MPSCDRSQCRVVAARSYRAGIGSVLVPLTDPLVDLPFGLVASDAVAFLNFAHELLRLALDEVQIVIGQHAPLLANLALELVPLSLERILVHGFPPLLRPMATIEAPFSSCGPMQ